MDRRFFLGNAALTLMAAVIPASAAFARKGADDGPTHDVNDDHGVDDADHDVNDDHGVDDADHDVNDDHGGDDADHDVNDDHGGDDDDSSETHGRHRGHRSGDDSIPSGRGRGRGRGRSHK